MAESSSGISLAISLETRDNLMTLMILTLLVIGACTIRIWPSDITTIICSKKKKEKKEHNSPPLFLTFVHPILEGF